MKYFFLIGSILLVCARGGVLTCAAEEPSVSIVHMEGDVTICRQGEEEFKPAAVDDVLFTGDQIKTKAGAYVEIAFDDEEENVVRINENSHVALLLKENEKIELVDGKIYSTVNKLQSGSSFEIRTPTAVCGVRGTEWSTTADSQNTTVETFQNNTYIKTVNEDGSLSAETVVTQGYRTQVPRFKPPMPFTQLTPQDHERWNAWKGEARRHIDDFKVRKREGPWIEKRKMLFDERMKRVDALRNKMRGPGGERFEGPDKNRSPEGRAGVLDSRFKERRPPAEREAHDRDRIFEKKSPQNQPRLNDRADDQRPPRPAHDIKGGGQKAMPRPAEMRRQEKAAGPQQNRIRQAPRPAPAAMRRT